MKPPAGDSIHDLFNPQSLEVTNNLWKGHLTIQKKVIKTCQAARIERILHA